MNEISIIEYNNWNKVILYTKLEDETNWVKSIVNRIVWDEELEKIKYWNLKYVNTLIDNILSNKEAF